MKPAFIAELEMLLTRFSYLGMSADIASMGLIELWGVYRYLQRLAEA
ncbi:MAG: hypothetical protein NVS3B3_21600 [Aquirhabdus sp.]